MAETLRVIDPHIHLWDLSTGLYPGLEKPSTGFIGSNAPIARSYLLDEFLGEGAGEVEVLGAVHVEAFPTDPVAETRHLQSVADQSPIPIGIVANTDLTARNAEAILEAHAAFEGFRGVRQVLNRHPDPLYNYVARDFIADPAFEDGFKLLRRHGASFDLQLYPSQMADAAALAGRHPDIQVVLNHAGMWVDRTLSGWRAWKDGLWQLAERPNIAVKISGLGMLDRQWTVESIRPLVLETIDAFGTGRAVFASNFPVDKLFSDYPTLWRAFTAIVADFSEAEKEALFRGNAGRIYRIRQRAAA
jgi:predicted TIM-barrel fold metal-dependent hydrolase